jgi:tripartite-type tricarboxylate transporter receptor subunit TctC
MEIKRRQFLHLAAGAAALPAVSCIARAQAYPTRPVRVIVGFAPGGGSDIYARLIGQSLTERLGQPFIIENRPSAGGNIATEAVANAPADGYTLLLVGSSNTINPALYDKLNFNFIRDIAPVTGISVSANIMEVNPSVPVKTVPEFIAYAKANPGKVNFASGGNGSSQHLSGELFKMLTGVNMVHVPYRGEALALPDLLSGQVQILFGNMSSSLEHVRSGRLRRAGCGVATRSRDGNSPQLNLVREHRSTDRNVTTRSEPVSCCVRAPHSPGSPAEGARARPCEAITIRSQPLFSAVAMIPSAGCCSGTCTSSQATPAIFAVCAAVSRITLADAAAISSN